VNLCAPLGSRVEIFWNADNLGTIVLFVGWDDVGTASGKELLFGLVLEWVGFSILWLPEAGLSLDGFNHLLINWVSGSNDGHDDTDNDELESLEH